MSTGVFKVRHEPSQMFPGAAHFLDSRKHPPSLVRGELCPAHRLTCRRPGDPANNLSLYLVLGVVEENSRHLLWRLGQGAELISA